MQLTILVNKMAKQNEQLERLIGSKIDLPPSVANLEILRGMVQTAKLAKGK